MNIFFLDTCPITAAQMQVKKSAVKMVLESAQLLSTAVREHGYTGSDVYKSAYLNHPSNVWARRSKANFEWLYFHAIALCEQYTKGSGKVHKSQAIIERCGELISLIPNRDFKLNYYDLAIKSTPEGLAALAEFQGSKGSFEDATKAYRKFYQAKWYVAEKICFLN